VLSARRATIGRENAYRIGRVGVTAWASGFDQNKSPFSRVRWSASSSMCVFAVLDASAARGTRVERAFYLVKGDVPLSNMMSGWQ
jgi:hypothetical protein